VESNWVHSARRPPNGVLYLPRVNMLIEKLVEWLAGENEILGENLPQCHFVHHKSHMTWPSKNPGRRGGKPATKRLSYDTANYRGKWCTSYPNSVRSARSKIILHLLFIHSFISSMALQLFVGPWPLLQFRNLFDTNGRTPWTSDQPIARPLPTYRRTQTQNKRTHKHQCLWVRSELTVSAFERAKTVHALDRAATAIGLHIPVTAYLNKNQHNRFPLPHS
jgi:hypothetical protein